MPSPAKQTEGACQHCGALVYPETKTCPHCGKFPIKLRICSHCRSISPSESEKCWKCKHAFNPEGDYL